MNQEPIPPWQPQQSPYPQQPFGQSNWDYQTRYEPPTLPNSLSPQYQYQQPYLSPYQLGQSPTQWPLIPPPDISPHRMPEHSSWRRLSIRKFILYIGIVIIILGILGGLSYAYISIGSHQKSISSPPVPPIGTKLYTFTSPSGATSPAYLSWSQDGTQLSALRMSGRVQVWNTTTWNNVLNYVFPYSFIMAAAWSPDQMYLATVNLMDSDRNAVRVWDVATRNEVLAFHGNSPIAWSPDGTRIATGSDDRTVHIWDASTGNNILTFHNDSYALAWSPDGKYIASADLEMVHIWDAATGNTLLTFHHHTNSVWRLSWSPNDKYIALAGAKDSTIQIWDTANGHQLLTYRGHSDAVFCVAWSPDGTHFASGGGDQTVQIWDAATGKHIFTHYGQTKEIGDLVWSPDGRFIASSAYDGTLEIWWAV